MTRIDPCLVCGRHRRHVLLVSHSHQATSCAILSINARGRLSLEGLYSAETVFTSPCHQTYIFRLQGPRAGTRLVCHVVFALCTADLAQ